MILNRFKTQRLGFFSVSVTVILFAAVFSHSALAENFPTKEIELVINFAPGGSTDMMSRIIGNKVSKHLGVPIVYNNKPGGGGAIAANYVANAKPDGYTIGTGGCSNMGTLLVTGENIPYTLKNFSGIARGVFNPIIIVAKKGRFDNFESFVKEAKQKPGVLIYGSWGAKSPSHMVGELISQVAGIKMKHVPFEGGAKALVAVLGGHIDLDVATIAATLSNLKAGTIIGLALTTETRVEQVPEVPTLKELGYPEATFALYDGFVTSSKVPKERLAILNSAFEKGIKDPEVQDALKKAGMNAAFLNGQEYEAFLTRNLEMLNRVATKAGIK